MKKILFSLSLIGFLGLTSCSEEDFLDYEPSNSVEVDDNTILNDGQLQTAVFGIYDAISSNYAYGNYYVSAQELLTDNGFVLFDNSNRFTDFYRYQHAISSGGSISNMWTIGYRAIARANFVLSFEEKTDATGNLMFTSDAAKVSFAEARTLRALELFNLVNYYARPYGTIDQDMGIPVPTVFERDTPLPRKSVEEVYNEITSQLELAAQNLPSNAEANTAQVTKEAVYGLLSRVYLYKKDYQKAVEFADLALAESGLMTQGDLLNYYQNPLSYTETLFAIDFTEIDNPNTNDALYATWTPGGTYEDTAATTDFYNLIPDSDARKDLYVQWSSTDNPLPYGVLKFGGVDNDVVVIRATEVLLNKIEALYYINPTQAQTELVNWVQSYRNAAYSFSGTGQALLEEILLQRRIELAFEGHRYFDMNRYQMDLQRNANCTVNCEVPFADYKRVFPIPLNEMNTNPEMIQNPNYQ
ncbi:RagB/SusD family nutrient uptake outer membrane protein [Moheibacter sp.]|uniref:RagB/SusD family nutrient uptake outer membrane protein n=1 Tax=Moheibacter sp. TaxID=1965316 RepID=UPI003C77DBCF